MSIAWKISLLTLLAGSPAVAQQGATPNPAAGEALFRHWCTACHGIGPGHPGTQSLAKAHEGTNIPDALERRTDLDPDMINYFIRHGSTVMPFFRKTELSDAEVADIAAWLTRNNPK